LLSVTLPVVLLQLLALELLKVLLENSGPTFRSNERFTAGQRDLQPGLPARVGAS
jgi:hypothetical protein